MASLDNSVENKSLVVIPAISWVKSNYSIVSNVILYFQANREVN